MSKFQALLVSEDSPGHFRPEVVARDIAELPAGEVLIRVRYSSPTTRTPCRPVVTAG